MYGSGGAAPPVELKGPGPHMRGVGPVCAGPFVDVRVVFPAEAKGDCLALAYVLFDGRPTDVPVNILDGLVRDLLDRVRCPTRRQCNCDFSHADCGSAWLLTPERGQYSERYTIWLRMPVFS
jgi:hypothetical protein